MKATKTTVSVRDLKNKLSHYLRHVETGEPIGVTKRGEVIAFLVPANRREETDMALELVREGLASWTGGKPSGSSAPIRGHGRPLSKIVLEDRR